MMKRAIELSLLIVGCCFLFLAACTEKPYSIDRPLTPQELHGQRLFVQTCRNCHWPDSDRPLSGPGLAAVFRKQFLPSGRPANDDIVRQTIISGRMNMPSYRDVFTDGQLADVLAYLHTL